MKYEQKWCVTFMGRSFGKQYSYPSSTVPGNIAHGTCSISKDPPLPSKDDSDIESGFQSTLNDHVS